MTDETVDAVELVAEEDGPEAAADQVAHELSVESAIDTLSDAAKSGYGKRHDRLAAVLSELRQKKEVEA